MSLTSRAQRAIRAVFGSEERGLYVPTPWITPYSHTPTVGVPVDRGSSLGISAVWACVRLLTSAVSRMPMDVLIDDNGTSKKYPTPRWIRRPIMENPNFGWIQHLEQVMMSLLFEGNFFTLTVRDNSNDVSEVFNLDPMTVEITGTPAAPGYKVRANGRITEYEPSEILHRPLLTMPGSQRGVSPIEAARMVVGVGLAAQEYQGRFFSQSATPPGYIKVPDGSKVTIDELKDGWEAKHSGPQNWHRPGVLTGGAEWLPIAISQEQAQFIEQRQFTVNEIARWFGVPPHLVGQVDRTTSWGTGIEEQGLAFIAYSLNDYLVLIEDAYANLVPNPASFVRFNRNALLRGDAASRGAFYQQLFAVGAINPDGIRAKEDQPPLPNGEGKAYFIPANFVPIERALQPPAPAALPTDGATGMAPIAKPAPAGSGGHVGSGSGGSGGGTAAPAGGGGGGATGDGGGAGGAK